MSGTRLAHGATACAVAHSVPRLFMRARGFAEATRMKDNAIRAMLLDETAQGLVEYALIIALVSIIAIAALRFLGAKASNTLNNAANALAN
jgi:pilus assembly protein Flp/PilA